MHTTVNILRKTFREATKYKFDQIMHCIKCIFFCLSPYMTSTIYLVVEHLMRYWKNYLVRKQVFRHIKVRK